MGQNDDLWRDTEDPIPVLGERLEIDGDPQMTRIGFIGLGIIQFYEQLAKVQVRG